MSNRNMDAINWAASVRGISPTAKVLLWQLATHVNSKAKHFGVYPSQGVLAEECEISVSGVQRHLKELIAAKLIAHTPLKRKGGGKSVNVYVLLLDIEKKYSGCVEIVQPGIDAAVAEALEAMRQSDALPSNARQSDRGVYVTAEGGAYVTAEGCIEPLKEITAEIMNITPSPTERPPTGESDDLFRQEIISSESQPLHEYVLTKWAALVEDFPNIQAIRSLNDSRKNKITARAREHATDGGVTITLHAVWDLAFDAIRGSQFLRGQAPPTRQYPDPFSLSIDHMLRPQWFSTTLEKAPINAKHNAVTHSADGRRFGPAEQAGRKALARILANRS